MGTGKTYRKLMQKKLAGVESQKSGHCGPFRERAPPAQPYARAATGDTRCRVNPPLAVHTEPVEKEQVINIGYTL